MGSMVQEHRDQLEAIWGKLSPWTRPSLGSLPFKTVLQFKHEIFFEFHFLVWIIIVPPLKWCHLWNTSLYPFLVLDPHHPKGFDPIYTYQPIKLLHFVGPSPLDPPSNALLSTCRFGVLANTTLNTWFSVALILVCRVNKSDIHDLSNNIKQNLCYKLDVFLSHVRCYNGKVSPPLVSISVDYYHNQSNALTSHK